MCKVSRCYTGQTGIIHQLGPSLVPLKIVIIPPTELAYGSHPLATNKWRECKECVIVDTHQHVRRSGGGDRSLFFIVRGMVVVGHRFVFVVGGLIKTDKNVSVKRRCVRVKKRRHRRNVQRKLNDRTAHHNPLTMSNMESWASIVAATEVVNIRVSFGGGTVEHSISVGPRRRKHGLNVIFGSVNLNGQTRRTTTTIDKRVIFFLNSQCNRLPKV